MSQAKRLAEVAQNILRIDSELKGFELIEKNIINEWQSSQSSDTEGRENCFHKLHILKELHRYLHKLVDNAKIEEYKEQQ